MFENHDGYSSGWAEKAVGIGWQCIGMVLGTVKGSKIQETNVSQWQAEMAKY